MNITKQEFNNFIDEAKDIVDGLEALECGYYDTHDLSYIEENKERDEDRLSYIKNLLMLKNDESIGDYKFKTFQKRKNTTLNILNKNSPSIDISIQDELSLQFNRRMQEIIIESLKRKGFEFENRIKLEDFIKSNCRCEDRADISQRTYFVNDIPFLLHCYKGEIDSSRPIINNGTITIKANCGSFSYL